MESQYLYPTIELCKNLLAGTHVYDPLSVSVELSRAKRKPSPRKLVREDFQDMASNKHQTMP
jgi:hypothetical protein